MITKNVKSLTSYLVYARTLPSVVTEVRCPNFYGVQGIGDFIEGSISMCISANGVTNNEHNTLLHFFQTEVETDMWGVARRNRGLQNFFLNCTRSIN